MSKRNKTKNGFSSAAKMVIEKPLKPKPLREPQKPEPDLALELVTSQLPLDVEIFEVETSEEKDYLKSDLEVVQVTQKPKLRSGNQSTDQIHMRRKEWKPIEKLLIIYLSLTSLSLLAHWY
jgi:hypothetical protein